MRTRTAAEAAMTEPAARAAAAVGAEAVMEEVAVEVAGVVAARGAGVAAV